MTDLLKDLTDIGVDLIDDEIAPNPENPTKEKNLSLPEEIDPCIHLRINPGTTCEADIQRLLDALSDLHEALGGSGIDWNTAEDDNRGLS